MIACLDERVGPLRSRLCYESLDTRDMSRRANKAVDFRNPSSPHRLDTHDTELLTRRVWTETGTDAKDALIRRPETIHHIAIVPKQRSLITDRTSETPSPGCPEDRPDAS